MINKLQNKNYARPNSYANRCGRGFTLVEVISYLAILSTLVFGIALFMDLVTETRVKNQTINEVDQQSLQIMQVLTQSIRGAKSITTPTIGQSQSNLTVIDQNDSAIIFALNLGKLTINRGGGAVNLNNDRILVDNITFKNLSRPGTPDIIQINFTLSYNNVLGGQNYNYIKTYVASANLSK